MQYIFDFFMILNTFIIPVWAIISIFILYGQKKNIEKYKYKLEKENDSLFIKFESELKMLKRLSGTCLSMIRDVSMLFVKYDQVPENIDERQKLYNVRYRNAGKTCDLYENTLHSCSPFIPEEIFKSFEELKFDCRGLIVVYPIYYLNDKKDLFIREDSEDLKKFQNNTRELYDKWNTLSQKMRTYINDFFKNGGMTKVKEQVLQAIKDASKPVNTSEITKLTGIDKKEVNKAFAQLKKEEKITSPMRCKWEASK